MTIGHIRSLLVLFVALVFLPIQSFGRVLLVHLYPPTDTQLRALLLQPSRLKRREKVYQTLSSVGNDVQRRVSSFIEAQTTDKMDILPLWIQNTLVVCYNESNLKMNRFFDQDLLGFPGVIEIEEDTQVLRFIDAQEEQDDEEYEDDETQSNVKLLHAPEVWARGAKGKGVVVASIDSGVRYTHEALRDTFRGTKKDGVNFDYSFWFTPGTDMSMETPDTADEVGHGTHTMGTAVGQKGVGIAPEATWITARAFDIWGAANKSDFLLAAQWVLCPTKMDGTDANCSLGADVVTNSFGVDRSTPVYPHWKWLSKVIDTWRAAGVYPVFASGNTNGFLCGSVYYPGSRKDTIAVGALIGGISLWGASGKGPSLEGDNDKLSTHASSEYIIKPDFVAPGVGIRSAMSVKDSVYTRLTGTSMATPHVAGAIALLLSLNHTKPLAYEEILRALTETTTRNLHKPFLVPSKCGNTTYHEFPNNIYGWGLVDVCLAADHLGFPCSDSSMTFNRGRKIGTLDDAVASE